jgi:hypothetical protein
MLCVENYPRQRTHGSGGSLSCSKLKGTHRQREILCKNTKRTTVVSKKLMMAKR